MSWSDHVATAVTEHSVAIIVIMVLLTAVFGVGIGSIEQSSSVSGLSDESEVADAYDDVRTKFSIREANTTTSLIAVRTQEQNALSKESLLRTLRYQRALHDNETLAATLADEQPTVSVANLVARTAIAAEASGRPVSPSLDEQITQLESMNSREVSMVVKRLLDPESSSAATQTAYRLLPREYDPGSTEASGHLIVMTQKTEGEVRAAAAISEHVSSGQATARVIAKDQSGSEKYYVYGRGLMNNQQTKAISDSFGILGPLSLLFILVSLTIAYRDLVDIVLGLVGVTVVLIWTMGSLGWLGIKFNQTMIAVPILLIGLSVDYALHVVMRYREERVRRDEGVRSAIARSLTSVLPALALVTMSTAIGFLANLTSPAGDIQSFGILSAIGITATLFVFGLFVPALKTVISSFLSGRGREDTPSALGATGTIRSLLGGGASMARRAPLAIVLIGMLLTAGGAYGATQVEVATPQTSFMADDPPAWTEDLPQAVEPGEFYLKENRRYIYSKFQAPDKQGYVLVEGNVTASGTLDRVAAAEDAAAESDAIFDTPTGKPGIVTPLSAMQQTAEQNETFGATFRAADTDGDGVPDRNLKEVYDGFYATAPNLATRTIHRTDDGEYTALRLRIAVNGNVDRETAVAPLESAVTEFDGASGVHAIATGQPVISKNLNDRIATTLIESLSLTLAVILVLLMIVFRVREGSASLGAITLVPVAFSVSWLLGTMALLDIPIGLITALVGSISVGLGVDYAIHVSERFAEEWNESTNVRTALVRMATGTGSALLSSAVTTAVGFGVLSFSLLPALRQFGFILAVGIVYSFLASVYIQPSVLALWVKYGPGTVTPEESSATTTGD